MNLTKWHTARARSGAAAFAACVLGTGLVAAPAADAVTAHPRIVRTITVGQALDVVATDSSTNNVYVGNSESSKVAVFDGLTLKAKKAAHVGCCGQYGLATDATESTVYATDIDDNNIFAFHEGTNKITGKFDTGAEFPTALAVDPLYDLLYSLTLYDNNLLVIDPATGTVTATVAVGDPNTAALLGLSVNPITRRVYIADAGAGVWVLNEKTNKLSGPIKIGAGATDVVVDAITDTVYGIDGTEGTVAVINGKTGCVTKKIHLGGSPGAVALDFIAHRLYVTDYAKKTVAVIDTTSRRVIATLHVPQAPVAVAADPSSGRAYVVESTKVTVIAD